MRRTSGVIHAIGECRDCGRTFEQYKNALALSAQHAKRTGHHVVVEQCISVAYNPPGEAT